MSKDNTVKKVAIGAAVAGSIGFLAGILFAPKSGKETRQDIKKAASTAKAELEKKLKVAHTELQQLISEAKKRYASGSKTIKKDLDALMKQASQAQTQVKEILSALHDGNAEDPDLKEALKEANAARDHLKKYLAKSK